MKAKLFFLLGGTSLLGWSCSREMPGSGTGGFLGSIGGRIKDSGGGSPEGGFSSGSSLGGKENIGSGGTLPVPIPRYHPPPGFEECKHAEVRADCQDGWCKLPPSCFVMGSAEDEWKRGRDSENQVAVTLTHHIEVQQKELTRAEWEDITKTPAPGPDNCVDPTCPVATVTWWDAVTAADLLSAQKNLAPCYEPVGCTGTLGMSTICTGVRDPSRSVYECEGYRLLTRTEAEYATRAGTISTFYSGDITVYATDTQCDRDPALDLIAWYCWNSDLRAHPGGKLEPNGFGLYDMLGNLLEWNSDEISYNSSPGGKNPRGTVGTGRDRSIYRGQYDNYAWTARTAGHSTAPWDLPGGNQGGFRLVRTLDPQP
jgi:formylglycine-generating enzyme